MINNDVPRELSQLVLSQAGALEATGDMFLPYRLVDAEGASVRAVAMYFAEVAGCGRPAATLRSYGMTGSDSHRFLILARHRRRCCRINVRYVAWRAGCRVCRCPALHGRLSRWFQAVRGRLGRGTARAAEVEGAARGQERRGDGEEDFGG